LMLLPQFDYATVREAFIMEEHNHQPHASTSSVALNTAHPSKSTKSCTFCNLPNHTFDVCWRYKEAKNLAEQQIKDRRKGKQGGDKKSNISKPDTEANIVELTENASALIFGPTSSTSALLVKTSSDWTADTGASSHMTPHRHWFKSYQPVKIPIRLADGQIIYSAGMGSVQFKPNDLRAPHKLLEFHKVLHVPNLQNNLLSVLYLTKHKQYTVSIVGSKMSFSHGGSTLFTATVNDNNTALLNGITIPMTECAGLVSTCPLDISLWHRHLGHLNFTDVQHLISKELVSGITIKISTPPDPICEPCIAGKQHRIINKRATSRSTIALSLIHSDLHGPLPVRTQEGYRYWITFIDDATRLWIVSFLHAKSEAFTAFKCFKQFAENLTDKRIKCLRDDKGGEYISNEFDNFLTEAGISRQHTVRNEPHQNGVAERANRTLAEGATTLLAESNLPASFWSHAIAALVHVRNRSPTASLGRDIPYTSFYGKKPDISHLRIFGCSAYVHVQKDKCHGLSPHTQKCVFIGYPPEYKGWLFYNPMTKKTIISNTAEFDERVFPGLSQSSKNVPLPPEPEMREPEERRTHTDVQEQVGDLPLAVENIPAQPPENPPRYPIREHRAPEPFIIDNSRAVPNPASAPRYPTRERRAPEPFIIDNSRMQRQYREPTPAIESSDEEDNSSQTDTLEITSESGEESLYTCTDMESVINVSEAFEIAFKAGAHNGDPKTFAEAMKRDDAELWYKSACDEIQTHLDNGTWKLAKLPPGRKAIGSRWVFIIKRKADGSIERYRGRVVAKGFAQRPGFDYTETFAPTAKWAALRAIFAIAALEDMELESIDISSAYLNGELEEEVYMEQPEGFHQGAPDDYLKLLKGMYGLKQSGRIWHKKLDKELQDMGFSKVKCDHSIWVYQKDGTKVIIPVFVDDMTIISKSKTLVQSVKDELKKRFKLRDLGPTKFLLGVAIERDRNKKILTLSQKQYILDILSRYGHSDCNPVSTPMDPGCKLSTEQAPSTPEDIEYMKNIPYIHAVGSLMYLAISTRPDIAYTVGVLARFNSNPGVAHWKAVKHVFRYLKGTLDYKLTYGPNFTNSGIAFSAYSDADHGGDKDSGKSTGAYVVKIGTGAISWSSKLQTMVTLSTTEAEYIAAVYAGQEILWLHNLFSEIGLEVKGSSKLHIDNQSAVSVAKNPEHHGRIKQLDLHFYWLRDEVENGKISVLHIPTSEMPADILTKPLTKVKVEVARQMLGLMV
jgi:transposase InsO family protein